MISRSTSNTPEENIHGPHDNLDRLPVFEYRSERFGYQGRVDLWTGELYQLSNTSREERAKAGFIPYFSCNELCLRCQFCNVVINEPAQDRALKMANPDYDGKIPGTGCNPAGDEGPGRKVILITSVKKGRNTKHLNRKFVIIVSTMSKNF